MTFFAYMFSRLHLHRIIVVVIIRLTFETFYDYYCDVVIHMIINNVEIFQCNDIPLTLR